MPAVRSPPNGSISPVSHLTDILVERLLYCRLTKGKSCLTRCTVLPTWWRISGSLPIFTSSSC